jgi:hypothetical protein
LEAATAIDMRRATFIAPGISTIVSSVICCRPFRPNNNASMFLVTRGTFNMAAGVLHILAQTTYGSATCACKSGDDGGKEEEGDTLIC